MSGREFPAGQSSATADANAAAVRAALIGNRVTIAQAAAAVGCTERAIYKVIAERSIPFMKVLGTRYLELEDLRRALVQPHNTAPRGRGRPRKMPPDGGTQCLPAVSASAASTRKQPAAAG